METSLQKACQKGVVPQTLTKPSESKPLFPLALPRILTVVCVSIRDRCPRHVRQRGKLPRYPFASDTSRESFN